MVFPLYDDNPFKLPVPPYVTWGLIALNVLIFLAERRLRRTDARRMSTVLRRDAGGVTHHRRASAGPT